MAVDKNSVTREAQKFAAKGQYEKAIAEWKKLLKDSPHDANLYNTIGDLCLKKNAKAEAVDAYRRAADILAEDGFVSKAIALYKKVLNIDPSKVDVHLALGDMNADKGLTGNALESYKIVADHYKKQNNMDKALGIYQKMADLNPSNVTFRLKLAEMYSKQGMQDEAVKAYLAAADVHISQNAFQDARQMFEKVLSIEPSNKQVYHKAGVVYLKEGKFIEACKALKPAFDNDPTNEDLADSYIDALTKAGKDHDAEQVARKILSEDSGRVDLHEKLCQIYLGKKDYDKALDAASKLADARAEKGDHDGAVDILRKFIAASPHFSPGRMKLGELYEALDRGQEAANTFLQTGEILVDEGDQEGAKVSLARALEIVPDMTEAKELLERLATSALTAPPPPEPEEPQLPGAGEAAADIMPVLEEPVAAASEAPAYKSPDAAPPAGQASVANVEDPAITSACNEVDVLVKYGLATKALEQLENLALRFPASIQVRIKLRDIYGDLGQMSKSAGHMLVLADLYAMRGLQDQAQEVLRSALAIDPGNTAVMSKLGIAPEPDAPAAQAMRTGNEAVMGLPGLAEASHEEASSEEARPEGFTPSLGPAAQPVDEESSSAFQESAPFQEPAPTDETAFEGLAAETPHLEESLFAESPPAAPFPVTEFETELFIEETSSPDEIPVIEPKQQFDIGEPSPFEERSGAPQIRKEPDGERAQPLAPLAQDSAVDADIGEIWAEAEFYYQQGLFDEAKKHYAKIIELNPGESQAIARLADISREEEDTREFTKLADAVESLESALSSQPAEKELPLSASDEEAVRSLMSEIAELKKVKKNAAPPRQPSLPEIDQEEPADPLNTKKSTAEENFFDLGVELAAESNASVPEKREKPADEFFDLASELKDELGGIAVPPRPAAEEQSLDEIFEEFRRGVEQQSTKEDADTHYNLGVAYKEMGLLDDAIDEFVLTPEGEPKFIQSRYMLGLCYMEQGEYDSAIGELENALKYSVSAGEGEESRIGIHYDLGLAYQGARNITNAVREFQKVQSINPGYRDIRSKLKELKQGVYISPDQLKDDIEKEISAKFLEEGERIEREEKTRKNEKVRK